MSKVFNKFKIEVEYEGRRLNEFVTRDTFIVGRSKECDLFVDSKNLSRKHMKVTLIGDDIFVEDLNSTNGCFLDGEKIKTETLVPYTPNMKLALGKHEDVVLTIVAKYEKIEVPVEVMEPVVKSKDPLRSLKNDIVNIFKKDPLDIRVKNLEKAEHEYKQVMNQVEILKTEIIERAEARADKILEKANLEAKELLDGAKSKSNLKESATLDQINKEIDIKNSEIEKLKTEYKSVTSELSLLDQKREDLAELKRSIEKNKNDFETQKAELDSVESSLLEKNGDLKLVQVKLSEKEKDFNKFEEQSLSLQQEIKSLEVDIRTEKDTLNDLKKEFEEFTEKKKSVLSEVEDANSIKEQSIHELSQLKKEKNDLEILLREQTEELQAVQNKVSLRNGDLTDLIEDNLKEKEKLDLLQREKDGVLNELDSLKNQTAKENQNVVDLKALVEDLTSDKTSLVDDVAQLKESKFSVSDELKKLNDTLFALKNEAADFKDKSKKEAEAIIINAQEKARVEAEKILRNSKSEIKEKEDSLLNLAKSQAKEIVEKAELDSKKQMEESKTLSEEIFTKAEQKTDVLVKEAQARADELRDRAQLEHKKLIKDAEDEANKIKMNSIHLMDEKKKDFVELEKKRMRKGSEVLKSELNVLLLSKLRIYLKDDSEETLTRVKISLEKAVSTSMLDEILENDEEMYALLDDQVLQQQNKSKNYWRYTVPGAFLSIIVLYFAVPFFKGQIEEQSRKVASVSKKETETRIKKMDEEAKKELFEFFNPKKSSEFRDNYTDRVLYTEHYADLSLEKEYREDWILELQSFFTDQLELSENSLVPFISQEANMIRELVEQSKKINGKFIEQGINKMREIENDFLVKLKSNLSSDSDYKKVTAFQKKFFNKRVKKL